MAMDYRRVGRTGLFVSRICVGTVAFGLRLDEPDSLSLIDRMVGEGINFFDTANSYNDGRSEEILGKAIRGRRYDTVVASKVGAGTVGLNICNLSRKHIFEEIEGTLRRLGTDYVDIYYAHQWDPVTPIEETLVAFGDLVRQGKVRYLGASNFFAWQLVRSQWLADVRGLARFDCIQPRYNLLERDIETEVIPFCVDDDISIFPYGSLAGGMLSGKYLDRQEPEKDSKMGTSPNYYPRYWGERAFDFIDRLKVASDAAGHTLTQTSLAWLLQRPRLDAAIVGLRTVEQLEAALSALGVELSDEEREACAASPLA